MRVATARHVSFLLFRPAGRADRSIYIKSQVARGSFSRYGVEDFTGSTMRRGVI
jgi:hypothetical protein